VKHNQDLINLLRLVEERDYQFAGEPEQKPGDQVRGTDVAKASGRDHPFKGRLVGEDTTLEDVLSKKYQDFKELQSKEKEEITDAANPAQQAAIAIAMKKAGKRPKSEEKETVSELSKETLKKYAKANVQDQLDRATSDSFKSGQAGDKYNKAPFDTPVDKKREKGLSRALDKLSSGKFESTKSNISDSGASKEKETEFHAKLDKLVHNTFGKRKSEMGEAGPFSYGAKKPRKGSVADLADKKRREQEKSRPPIEPKDQMVGTAKVTKGVAEGYEPGDKITWYHSNHYPEIEGTVVGWKDGHLIVKSVDPSPRNTEKTIAKYRVPKNNIVSHTKQGVAEGSEKTFTVVYYSKKTDRNVTKQIKASSESELWDRLRAKGIDVVSIKEQGVAEDQHSTKQDLIRRLLLKNPELEKNYLELASIEELQSMLADLQEGRSCSMKEAVPVPPTPTSPTAPAAAKPGSPTAGSISPDEQKALDKIKTNPAMKQQFDKLLGQTNPAAKTGPMALDPEQQQALEKLKANAGLKNQYDQLLKQANPAIKS
jgi:hypothetical protein